MERPTLALALDSGPKKPLMGAMGDEAAEGAEPPGDEATDPSLVEAGAAVRAAMSGSDDEEFAKTLKGFIQLCGDY